MTETIEYEQLEQADGSTRDSHVPHCDLSRLSDIPMELSVEIGRTHMTVGETLDLRVGSVVALERLAGETADLLVNGSAIARGEVVVIDEQYGLRITEILDGQIDVEPALPVAPSSDTDAASDGGDATEDDAPVSEAEQPAATGEQPADAAQQPAADAEEG